MPSRGQAPPLLGEALTDEVVIAADARPLTPDLREGPLALGQPPDVVEPLPGRADSRWGRLTGQRPGVPAFALGFPRALRQDDGQRVILLADPRFDIARPGEPGTWAVRRPLSDR